MTTQNRLTFFERQQIESLFRQGWKIRNIANQLGRNHTVISREVNRNTGQYPDYFPYSAVVAQKATERRAKLTNTHKLDRDPDLKVWVGKKLKKGWSPEQIAGRLRKKPPPKLTGKYISDEAIYTYIYQPYSDGESWWQYLRKAHYLRRKQHGRKPQQVRIPDKVSIHDRPEVVNQRDRLGDWESDLISFSRQLEAVSVQYERRIQAVKINKVKDHGAKEKTEALIKTIEVLPLGTVKTITFDNGGENAKHTQIQVDFDVQTYFCDPYASWQKGGVENMNGLLRQYLPKSTDMTQVTNAMIQTIENHLNTRPRKALGYLTPNECLKEYTRKAEYVH